MAICSYNQIKYETENSLDYEVQIMMNRFSEKDWKLFRKKIPGWQEAYMDKLNKEYIENLNGEGESIR